MVMVVHQASGMAKPVELPDRLSKCLQKGLVVLVVLENSFAPVAPRGDVIQGVGEFDADGA